MDYQEEEKTTNRWWQNGNDLSQKWEWVVAQMSMVHPMNFIAKMAIVQHKNGNDVLQKW